MFKSLELKLGTETTGMAYGLFGIIGFSLTLPATRIAVQYLNPVLIGLGRALVAGILAMLLLYFTKQSLPSKSQLKSLVIVALGVIVGFPILSAWALQSVPSIHGAIIVGFAPLATVIVGVFRAGEQPSKVFWLISLIGALIIVLYALISHGGTVQLADLALLAAVASAAIGYAEGAKLSKSMGGWRVISWALVISIPFLFFPVLWAAFQSKLIVPLEAWVSFGYVSLISQFIAFFAWYKGLAMGGIAKVGQVQLLQPFFTILASAFLLGEEITLLTVITMVSIALVVAAGKFASVNRSVSNPS
jgi:drug/metabolite transporter (DMT)-like permease